MRYLLFLFLTTVSIALLLTPAMARESELKGDGDSVARKVSFSSSDSGRLADFGCKDYVIETAFVVCDSKAQMANIGGGIVEFRQGEAFIHAMRPTLIRCAEYDVWIPPGAMVLITYGQERLKVRSLYDEHKNVILYIKDRSICLKCGQEAVVGADSKSVKHEIVHDRIARRSMHIFEFSKGTSVLCSQFHGVSLIKQSTVLTRVIKANSAVSGKLLKTAASLSIIGAKRGPYLRVAD